jgi:hypothetical protein
MFVFAMIFYGVVGLFLGAAVLHCLGLLPDSGKGTRTTSTAKTDQNLKPGAVAFLLLSAVSLPVVLAWFVACLELETLCFHAGQTIPTSPFIQNQLEAQSGLMATNGEMGHTSLDIGAALQMVIRGIIGAAIRM